MADSAQDRNLPASPRRIASSAGLNAWVGLNDGAGRTGWDAVITREGPVYMASGSSPDARDRSVVILVVKPSAR